MTRVPWLVLLAALAAFAARAAAAQTQLVIVSGLGGTAAYTQSFAALGTGLARAAHDRAGVPDSAIAWYGEPTAPQSKWLRGASTRANVQRAFAALAQQGSSGGQVVVVLIGHGSGEGPDSRISLPGPDVTAAEFARLLGTLPHRRVAFVNLTSASGDMLALLAAPNRVVMTATKSAFERNESQFARFFVAAFAADGADTDKDGRVSLLEAYAFADAEVKRFYETEGRLATEHAQLADEDQLARRFFLSAGPGAVASGNARLDSLYAARVGLEDQIQALKTRKAGMTADAYDARLEELLLALARTAREIRELEGRSGS